MQVFEDFAGAEAIGFGILRALQTDIELDREIAARAKADGVARRFMTVPESGP